MENQLIQLYLRVCQTYDTCSSTCFQRLSNNSAPVFTDQELITIFFFGHDNGLFQKKAIYKFTRNYWKDWFPHLPSYQTFCYRLNLLEQTFQALGREWLNCLKAQMRPEIDRLIDSFPIMLAKHGHAYSAKVGREIANKGYCAAKRTHFHGVRLHTIAYRRSGHLPLPDQLWLRAASRHDLESVREQRIQLPTSSLFGDKAFPDPTLEQMLKEQETRLITPLKKPERRRVNRDTEILQSNGQPSAATRREFFQLAERKDANSKCEQSSLDGKFAGAMLGETSLCDVLPRFQLLIRINISLMHFFSDDVPCPSKFLLGPNGRA
jgi:hypothetical protein